MFVKFRGELLGSVWRGGLTIKGQDDDVPGGGGEDTTAVSADTTVGDGAGEDTVAGGEGFSDDDLASVDHLKGQPRTVRETIDAAALAAAGGALSAPAHWTADDKKLFEGVKDRAVKEWLVKRDKDHQTVQGKAGTELTAIKKDYDPIVKLFEPYKEMLAKTGQPIHGIVANYLKVEEHLKNKPVESMAFLMSRYGVTLEQLTATMQKAPVQTRTNNGQTQLSANLVDQLPDDLRPAFEPFAQRLETLEANEKRRIEDENKRTDAEMNTAITRFESAKSRDGKASLRPHAAKPAIRKLMSEFISSGRASMEHGIDDALDKAYALAIRADDETYQATLKTASEEAVRKEAEAREQRAKKARGASVSLGGGSSPQANAAPRKGSVRDTLNRVAQESGYGS